MAVRRRERRNAGDWTMPLFHLTENDIKAVTAESFSARGISERSHLQRVLRSKL